MHAWMYGCMHVCMHGCMYVCTYCRLHKQIRICIDGYTNPLRTEWNSGDRWGWHECMILYIDIYLVGGFNHLENISQWEGLSHLLWKN